jgi:glycosyltransferase involved in cell wall biosynthesis
MPAVIQDGTSGFVVELHDESALARHLAELGHNRPLALRLGRSGSQLVRQRFSLDRLLTDIVGLYERLL